ncbi:MAG TPA: hypothetical protein VGI65_02405 [Steroidobacteraceae bacterium]
MSVHAQPVRTLPTPPPVAPTAVVKSLPGNILKVPVPRGFVLYADPQPAIAPYSEMLLFVHGMDSRTEEADDITKAIFNALATRVPVGPPPNWPPMPANAATVHFTNCPDPSKGCPEACPHPDAIVNGQASAVVPFDTVNGAAVPLYFEPIIPQILLDSPAPPGQIFNVPAAHNLGSNEGRLRADLRAAAAVAQPAQSLKQAAFYFATNNPVLGNAFADLSVTGRRSFAIFRQLLPQDAFCQSLGAQPPTNVSASGIVAGCQAALRRAYRVANFLRNGERGDTPALKTAKINERNALGWIAVSGEDDAPHRPVNVPSSDFPQFDLQVVVATPMGPTPAVNVSTRFTIAQFLVPSTGKNVAVISVDLPTSGYADNIDYRLVSPLAAVGQPVMVGSVPVDFHATGMTPLLDFIETFIVRFVDTLDQRIPLKNNIRAVMGGSLGGNMTFRLGRRTDTPWFPNFVVWSPASIWSSLGAGNDLTKHVGIATAWRSADQSLNSPSPNDRAAFFGSWDKPIVPIIIPMAQSDTWTSDYYLCKKSSVAGARLDRQETYDPRFLAWHWRLGMEQLLYSHQNPISPPSNMAPLFTLNKKPMLLACGLEDHVPYNDICPATVATVPLMIGTPGKALFLDKTGHSLDNERPTLWSEQIIGFLGL